MHQSPADFDPPDARSLADYDAEMSLRADRGTAIRSAAGVIALRDGQDVVPFWLDRRSAKVLTFVDGAIRQAGIGDVLRCLGPSNPLAVPIDRRALRAMIGLVESDMAARHQLDVEGSIPWSSRVVVLATALKRQLWLDHRRDEDDLNAWMAALGLRTGPDSIRSLVARLAEPDPVAEKAGYARMLRKERDKSDKAMANALYPRTGYYSRNLSFAVAEHMSAVAASHAAVDRLLRHRAAAAGAAVRATPLGVTGAGFLIRLDSLPASIREDDDIYAYSAHSRPDGVLAVAKVSSFAVRNGQMHALLGAGYGRGAGKSLGLDVLDAAAARGERILLARKPHGSPPSQMHGRWEGRKLSAGATAPRQLEVPAYVVIAGAGA